MIKNFGAKALIHNAASGKPWKKVVQPDGTIKKVTMPMNPNRKLMVSPAGNIVWLILSNGAAQTALNTYGVQKLQEKMQQGFLPYGECPITKGYLRGKKGCEGDDGRGGFEDGKCCKCMSKIILGRKEAYAKQTSDYHDRLKTDEDIMRDYMKIQILEKAQAKASGPE